MEVPRGWREAAERMRVARVRGAGRGDACGRALWFGVAGVARVPVLLGRLLGSFQVANPARRFQPIHAYNVVLT